MSGKQFKTYQTLNLDNVALNQFSKLYSINPIGIGTPLIESLTRYISRLAYAHCVYPGILMERVIQQSIKKQYSSAEIHKIYNSVAAINGTGVMGIDTIKALSTLTLQPKLYTLTLTELSQVLPSKKLLHTYRLWCPKCYQDWNANNHIIYEPLIWKLRAVTICPKHLIYLQDCCPHCHQRNYHLSWKTYTGYCSNCHQWLGQVELYNTLNIIKETDIDLNWHIWVSNNLGKVLKNTSLCLTNFSSNRISKSLLAYVDYTTNGNMAAFSRLLQIPRNTFWGWCQGKNKPSLEMLLRICYRLNISLWDFLTNDTNLLDPEIINSNILLPKLKSRVKPKVIEKEKLKKVLEEILEQQKTPPCSMEQVAKDLKISRRAIYNHFPELCRKISAQYLEYRKIKQQENVEIACQEVRQIVQELHSEGIFPSEKRVLTKISKPGFLRYEAVKQSFHEARQELGIR